ncbi:hypothetical protein BaRGS_00014808 [Batillaria attramentaria]|uniref:Uncharacterized protein n=1 Tax=Batillaria attramentaria TaxID=370345 RepID=A0ABD0L3T0_9CAEN
MSAVHCSSPLRVIKPGWKSGASTMGGRHNGACQGMMMGGRLGTGGSPASEACCPSSRLHRHQRPIAGCALAEALKRKSWSCC